jgi:uncharacterized protein (DUF2062 family)
MLFKRREDPDLLERLRVALWPRRSWGRSSRYFHKRLVRISATPHAIAAGVAAGIFISFTPFLGFHIITACVIAFAIGGNVVAAALGTWIGNPVTFPLIWAATYETGRVILGMPETVLSPASLADGLMHSSLDAVLPILEPMMVGALPVGLPFAAAGYGLTWYAVRGYQARRRERLRERAEVAGADAHAKVMERR